MRVTSVTGHIKKLEFVGRFKDWKKTEIEELFDAPVEKVVLSERKETVETIKLACKGADVVALWLDCDREGENIAYEVVEIVREINPKIEIFRARFSAVTKEDIETAVGNLGKLEENLSLAVDARQEIDLRLGSIFTRFQTEELNRRLKILGGRLISYGPCQFPTMGFVIKRYMEIQNFTQKPFWTLELEIQKNGTKITFLSDLDRCFDHQFISNLCEKCRNSDSIRITKVDKKPKIKSKPKPLCTVPFQKLASSKLKIDSDTAMKLAEKLYSEGFISYPRTETDRFPPTIDLKSLVKKQCMKNVPWKEYALKVSNFPSIRPRNGDGDDKSHPPIYPVKPAEMSDFKTEIEWKVYELITRHFLAGCGEDAVGVECEVETQVAGVRFGVKGATISHRNYLEVYPYQQWIESELPLFTQNEVISSPLFEVKSHKTQPPGLLTETDLIGHMDNAGIGTDSTIHMHIKTVQTRGYVKVNEKKQFQPTHLGVGLYMGYSQLGYKLIEPELRASMERGMTEIAKGTSSKETMVKHTLSIMKNVFVGVKKQVNVLEMAVRRCLLEDETSPYARASVVCYRCKEPGHVSSECPLGGGERKKEQLEEKKGSKEIKGKKKCQECGVVGRHPRNSTCSKVKKASKPTLPAK